MAPLSAASLFANLLNFPEAAKSSACMCGPPIAGTASPKSCSTRLNDSRQLLATSGSTLIPRRAWTPPFAFTSATDLNPARPTTTIHKPIFIYARNPLTENLQLHDNLLQLPRDLFWRRIGWNRNRLPYVHLNLSAMRPPPSLAFHSPHSIQPHRNNRQS